MKFTELQRYGEYSVVLRQDSNGNRVSVSPFVVVCSPRIVNGEIICWAFGHYFEDLFEAVNFARTKTEMYHPNFHRLCEIASKTIDGLVEDDEGSAYDYFANEIEMDDDEANYFGLDVEMLESYK